VTTFADSSALVKLYADEDGHEIARYLEAVVVSHLARVEVPAALWRKQRMGELSAEDAQVLTSEFEADWFGTVEEPPRFAAVALAGRLLDQAAQLCASRGLRAYDAVQLSCAVAARAADESCTSFAAFDGALRAAAAAEGSGLRQQQRASSCSLLLSLADDRVNAFRFCDASGGMVQPAVNSNLPVAAIASA
jgi:predicted nucleic acid-binding protein